jgi:hypothetical protein
MIKFYNQYAYWASVLGDFDAQRKVFQSFLEQARDKAKAHRAQEAKNLGLKSTLQDAFIRNCWSVEIEVDGKVMTPEAISNKLNEIVELESEARNCMNICQTAVDICRSALSWDKQEVTRLEG